MGPVLQLIHWLQRMLSLINIWWKPCKTDQVTFRAGLYRFVIRLEMVGFTRGRYQYDCSNLVYRTVLAIYRTDQKIAVGVVPVISKTKFKSSIIKVHQSTKPIFRTKKIQLLTGLAFFVRGCFAVCGWFALCVVRQIRQQR